MDNVRIGLRDGIVVRKTDSKVSLILDLNKDTMYWCSDDMANLMVILHKHRLAGKSLKKNEILKELADASASFQKNKLGEKCLDETLTKLKKADIVCFLGTK